MPDEGRDQPYKVEPWFGQPGGCQLIVQAQPSKLEERNAKDYEILRGEYDTSHGAICIPPDEPISDRAKPPETASLGEIMERPR